jgi:hypothetical protein
MLCLNAPLPIDAEVLGAIGEACLSLVDHELSGQYDLRALAHAQSPCMPNLERLGATTSGKRSIDNM